MWDFTPNNAREFLTILTPFVVIFATYITTKPDMKPAIKFSISAAFCVMLGALTAYAEGKLVENVWTNIAIIFTLSQALFYSLFKSLPVFSGKTLEALLFPLHAVASKVAFDAKQVTEKMPKETAQQVLDPENAVDIIVQTNVLQVSEKTARQKDV